MHKNYKNSMHKITIIIINKTLLFKLFQTTNKLIKRTFYYIAAYI